MSNIFNLLLGLASFAVVTTSCKKVDTIRKTEIKNVQTNNRTAQEGLEQVINFLEAQKDSILPSYQECVPTGQPGSIGQDCNFDYASKMDSLLSTLSNDNVLSITVDSVEMIVCDLTEYKNPPLSQYANTFYKVYFPIFGGQISDGLILTIHTNLTKSEIDGDISNIISQRQSEFTGMTVINYLNNQFAMATVFESGRIVKDYGLSHTDENGQSQRDLDNLNPDLCTAYYLVVTDFYSDGSSEQTWSLLFITCGNNSGGGGGGGSPSAGSEISIEEYTESSFNPSEVNIVVACPEPPIIRCSWWKNMRRGIVTGVTPLPMRLLNKYTDCKSGQVYVKRDVTIYNLMKGKTSLGFRRWRCWWSCDWIARYLYADGRPEGNTTGEFNANVEVP